MPIDIFNHVLFSYDNKLFAWGCNSHGQLGLGHTENVAVPTSVESDFIKSEGIKKVKCGDTSSCILTNIGNVYTSGNITKNDIHPSSTFVELSMKNIVLIDYYATYYVACSLDTIYIWGSTPTDDIGLDDPIKCAITCNEIRMLALCENYFVIMTDAGMFLYGIFIGRSYIGKKIEFDVIDSIGNIFDQIRIDSIRDIKCNNMMIIILTNDNKIYATCGYGFIQNDVKYSIDSNLYSSLSEHYITFLSRQSTTLTYVVHLNMSDAYIGYIETNDYLVDYMTHPWGIFYISNDKIYCRGINTYGILGINGIGEGERVNDYVVHEFLTENYFRLKSNGMKSAKKYVCP